MSWKNLFRSGPELQRQPSDHVDFGTENQLYFLAKENYYLGASY